MRLMKTITLTMVLVLACTSSALLAQENSADILVKLDVIAPIKSPVRGIRSPIRQQVDWEKAADEIGDLLARATGTTAQPMCMFYMGNALFNAGRIEEARLTFKDLKQRYSKHPLVMVKVSKDSGSLVQNALNDCAKEIAFMRNRKSKTLPKPILDESFTATLHFTTGDIEIEFFKNIAPKHRANFLKLAEERFYDRTCIHRIEPDKRVFLGCPNTRERLFTNWGRGGPGYHQPHEFSRLFHVEGVLTAAAAPRAGKSHGSQFSILLQPEPSLDFVQTPFAKVIKGMDVAREISVAQRNQNRAPLTRNYLNGITINRTGKKGQK